jgi:hypothetical protein
MNLAVPVNAPSMRAASELITAAAGRREWSGLVDVADLACFDLDRGQLIEVVLVLTSCIERMARPLDDVPAAITDDGTG